MSPRLLGFRHTSDTLYGAARFESFEGGLLRAKISVPESPPADILLDDTKFMGVILRLGLFGPGLPPTSLCRWTLVDRAKKLKRPCVWEGYCAQMWNQSIALSTATIARDGSLNIDEVVVDVFTQNVAFADSMTAALHGMWRITIPSGEKK